jgi:hypothetical protein
MRDFSNETPVNSSANWLRLTPAWLSGHLLPSVRTVVTDSANQTTQTLLSAGMRRVSVPQDAGERVDFVAKWVQRNQRRVAAGLPISVLVLALSAAEAQAQEELVSLAAQEGVESITILANGDVQVTYTNGNVVVLAENSVVISATGEVLVTVAVAEGAALSAGVAIAGGMGPIGAAGLSAAGLLASLSDGSADPATSGIDTGSGVGGRVIDGYIAGATVFRDLNANRILDAGEPSVTSDATGNFTGLTGTGGVIVSVGGTDISTGQPFTGIMTAPAGATVVTPLTTLVQAMVEQNPALSVADANLAVVRAFGIRDVRVEVPEGDESVLVPQNLLTFDPTTNFGGLDVFAAGAKVAAIMLVAAAAAGDTPAEQAAAVRAVALSLAIQIAQNPTTPAGGPLTQAAILDALDDALGDDDTNVDKTELLETIINAIEDAEQNEGTFSQVIGAIEDVQTYVQGELLVNIESGTIPVDLELAGGLANAVSLRPTISSFPRFFTLSEVVLEETPLQINGSGRPGSVVTVTFGGLTSDDIPVDTLGRWSFTVTADDLETVIEGTPVSTGPFGDVFLMQAVAKETTGGVTITSPVTRIGTFVVDLTAPDSPEITGQIAGDGIININEANSGVRVQGKVGADVDLVEYWINDGPRQTTFVMSTTTSTGSERIFEFFLSANAQNGALALPTSDAPFTLNIVSIDNGRNRSEPVEVTVNIDRVGPRSEPTLNQVSYENTINAYMAAEGVVVTGLVSLGDLSTLDRTETVRLTFDGQTFIPVVPDGFGNYSATLNAGNLPTTDGTYTLRAQRVDTAGNFTEASQSIFIDRTPPAAPTLNPLSDNRLNATEDLIITGTAEHDSTIIVRINGQQVDPAPVEEGTFAVTVPAQALRMARLTDGQITASVTATDMYGNTSTAATTTFTYDGTPPETPKINPQSDLIFNLAETANGVVFTGTAEPNVSVSLELIPAVSGGSRIFSEQRTNGEGAFTITFANSRVPDGTYTLRTWVEDAAVNVTRTDIPNVVVDRVAPNAPVMFAISGDNIINKNEAEASGPLMITGSTAPSTETLTNQVEVRFNGISEVFDVNSSGGYFAPFALSSLPATDGTYDVTVVAIDAAGNRSEPTTQSVTIDRTPPAAPVLTNPDQYTVLNAQELANGLTISGTALGAGLVSVAFGGLASGQPPNSETGAFSITVPVSPFSSVTDGSAEIIIDAYDAVGNVTSTFINTTIDRTPPAAAEITEVTVTDGIVTVTGTVPDETGAVLTLQLQPRQGGASQTFTATIEGTSFSFTSTTALADGNYFMLTSLADRAGNVTLGSPVPVNVGVAPEPTATELYATALTLDDMREAVATLIADAPAKFAGITPTMLPILAADLLMQRGGTYSISFTGEIYDALGTPTAGLTNNETGTDVSGTFHIPLDLINVSDDLVAQQINDDGVFEFSIRLPQGVINTFTGADALNLPTSITNLRMEVVATPREALPDDATLIQMLGEQAANRVLNAFAQSNGQPILFTYLIIWAPGATSEGPTFTGNDLTLVFSQLGDVPLNAFFTNPGETLSYVTNTQYGPNSLDGVVGAEIAATTSVSVEFTPTAPVTEVDLSQMLLEAAALRTAVANVIEAANTNKLTLQLLETLADIVGPTNGEAANALRLLAGEQLQAADVDRLFAFLVQPIADQTNALADYNMVVKFPATTLTEILDNTTLFSPSLLEGTQVFFDTNNAERLVINNTIVDVGGDVRELVGAGDVPVEMMWLDFTNSDLTWQITPGGNVVVAAYIDGPQTVPQDVILVYAPDGFLRNYVINTGNTSERFYINTTLSDADGIVFSMIDTATSHSTGSTAFSTYRVPLSVFNSDIGPITFRGEVRPGTLTSGLTPLLTFTVPQELDGLDFKPTSAIELTNEYGLSRMLIQVENADGDGIQTLLYTDTGSSTPTVVSLGAYVYDYSVKVDGPTPLGLLLKTNSLDTNGPEDGGVITQNSVYYFDLDLGEVTAVQTMGADDAQDALFGQGANDIIIPLGVTGSTTEENIYLPLPPPPPVSETDGPPVEETVGFKGPETIVVDLEDVFAGNKIAVYGFDLAQDKIAFFESDLFGPASSYNAIHVTVGNTSSFTLEDVLASASLGFVDSLTFFAVDDGANTILFATDGTRSGEVAWLNGVDLTTDGQPPQNLLVTSFALEDLLVPLPT